MHLWGETAIHHEQIIHLLSAETIRVGFMLDESHRYARLQVTPYHIYPLHDKSRYSCRIILAQFLLSLSHRTLRHQKKREKNHHCLAVFTHLEPHFINPVSSAISF